MALSENDRLNLALEIMSDNDVEKFEAVSKLAETENIDIYEALTKYDETHGLTL